MKRKVLRVGRSSLAVSLPKPFVETNHIESGQEIDVKHHGASLTVRCEKPGTKSKEVDISDYTGTEDTKKVLDKILGALFRQGLDHFTLKCADEEKVEIIREILQEGKVHLYEEPDDDGENQITVHSSITHFEENALENLTKVAVKEIYRTFEQFLELLEEDELTHEKAEELAQRDRAINDHTDICKRIVNKDVTNYQSTVLYGFADKLEKIGDEVKELIQYAGENGDVVLAHSEILEELKDFFWKLLSAKTNFSVKKINDFYASYDDMKVKLEECEDNHVYTHCRNIVGLIGDAYSNLMVCYM